MKRKFIFVLCPPFQGSTIIVNLLSSSSNVSTFLDSKTWAGESQSLYKKYGDIEYEDNKWNKNYDINFDILNNIFNEYLDKDKLIWVDKNPPSICRAKKIQDYFEKLGEVYFIISIRNPYSTRYKNCEKWIECAEYQKYNLENLKNVIFTTYEECCNDLNKLKNKIVSKIPELIDIKNIKNDNSENERYQLIHKNKVDRIIDKDNKNIILKNNIDLMNFFGYKFIE